MTKRNARHDASQMAFSFEPGAAPGADGGLAGLERTIANAVSGILKEDPRSRYEIAAGMSAMLDDEVSKAMLDAYSAEAKETHNISLARFLALVAETQRFDVLDQLAHRIGCKIIVGEEILTAELGHINVQMQRLREREALLRRVAPTIQRGGRRS